MPLHGFTAVDLGYEKGNAVSNYVNLVEEAPASRLFLEDISEDVLPNDRTGYENSLIWKKRFAFRRDAAVGIINKLERYDGCILADSVGLGKTFAALAVIKYSELQNRSVLALCPAKP